MRDMSAISDWHFKMSDTVVKLINGLPDAALASAKILRRPELIGSAKDGWATIPLPKNV